MHTTQTKQARKEGDCTRRCVVFSLLADRARTKNRNTTRLAQTQTHPGKPSTKSMEQQQEQQEGSGSGHGHNHGGGCCGGHGHQHDAPAERAQAQEQEQAPGKSVSVRLFFFLARSKIIICTWLHPITHTDQKAAAEATTTDGDGGGDGCCGGHGHEHDHGGGELDTSAPPTARIVTPGDCVPLEPEEEVLCVVGTRGLKVCGWVVLVWGCDGAGVSWLDGGNGRGWWVDGWMDGGSVDVGGWGYPPQRTNIHLCMYINM